MRDERRKAWEERMSWPLILAAVVFVTCYAWPILHPDLPRAWRATFGTVLGAIWLVFLVDYVVRVWLAEHKAEFVRTHIVDLLSVAVPALRPLQLLRALGILDRKLGESLHGRVGYYVPATTALVLMVASLAILDAERKSAEANITGLGDAVWWAFATMTTVGYGDHFPVTPTGRLVAIGLMIFGVALLGMVTATLASVLIDRFAEDEEPQDRAATAGDVAALREEIARLRAEVSALAAPGDEAAPGVNDGT